MSLSSTRVVSDLKTHRHTHLDDCQVTHTLLRDKKMNAQYFLWPDYAGNSSSLLEIWRYSKVKNPKSNGIWVTCTNSSCKNIDNLDDDFAEVIKEPPQQ